MEPEVRPAWLVRQENGVVAEARTRAFLLDQFWILERSVDVEGADFIIQRRLTKMSLLDTVPPRLGFVQSKNYANARTTQYVHSEYVLDRKAAPRSEFFLLCHSGVADSATIYFLTADDVAGHFNLAEPGHTHEGKFVLPGADILLQRFQVVDRASVLDKIERALKRAELAPNRSFMSWALPSIRENGPILEMYEEPIDNWWNQIPSALQKLKDRARRASHDFEEIVDTLSKIATATDPEEALDLAEQLESSYGEPVRIRLPDRLFDEDFYKVVQEHKKRYSQLKDAGLLGAHAAMRREIVEFIVADLRPRLPVARDEVYVVTLVFDPRSFLRVRLDGRVEKVATLWPTPDPEWSMKDLPDTLGILASNAGKLEAYAAANRCGVVGQDLDRKAIESDDSVNRARRVAELLVVTLMEAVRLQRFGELTS